MLIQDFLLNSVTRFPNKTALIHKGNHTTYTEILAAASSIAHWLSATGFHHEFRAAILTDDPFEYIATYFGILIAGGTAVGLNTQPSARGLHKVLNDCQVACLFTNAKFTRYLGDLNTAVPSLKAAAITGPPPNTPNLPWTDLPQILASRNKISPFPPPSLRAIAQIIYTSGTTGEPKGVMLRHSNLVANTNSIISYLKLTEQDRVMAVLPFFYSYGNSVLLTHIAVGGSLVVNQSFLYPNVILDEMVQEEVTGFSGVPSTYAILLNRSAIANYTFPSLRYLTQAGGPMSPKLGNKLREILPAADLYIMYGQTEASARLTYLPPQDLARKPGSIGKAIPGVNIQLLDPSGNPVPTGQIGEIVAQGKNIMAGYWGKQEETTKVLRKEGLWTGDLARMDNEGFLYIESRKSDMIKSGAHRIAPKEIEEIILEHNAVHEVAVIGTPDEILGEAIKACVVLKEGSPCSEKELLAHCRKNLPTFKVPHQIYFCNELPKTLTGKIQKQALKNHENVPLRALGASNEPASGR